MISLDRRLTKLEQVQRVRSGGVFTAFSYDGRMRVIGGSINFEGSADEGEKLLATLPESALVVRFNIPRPGIYHMEDSP